MLWMASPDANQFGKKSTANARSLYQITFDRLCCKRPYVQGDDLKFGCLEHFSCCSIRNTAGVLGCETRFDCCGKRVKSKGCVDICKKCDSIWGTPASECFEKEHNVVFIENWNKLCMHEKKSMRIAPIYPSFSSGTFRRHRSQRFCTYNSRQAPCWGRGEGEG